MSWPILLIISILFLSLNGLFHRSLLKDDRSDPRAQAIAFLGIGGIIAILIGLFRGTLHFALPPFLIFNLILIAALATLGYVLKYRGFQLINASEIAILSSTGKFWNVIGAAIFLHEVITYQKVLGTIIILIGIAIAMYTKGRFQLNKGLIFVLLSSFLFGLIDVNGFYILRTLDASVYQIYFYFLPVLALLLFQPKTIKKLGYYFKLDRGIKITLVSIFDVLGLLALFFAYQAGGKASVIGPLSATKVIVTVILAMIFLKERDNLTNKLIGALVSVIGVILLL